MSGSIGRSYLIQSWNDAASYSGEQIGNRLKESTDLFLANGKANIGLFEEKPKTVKKTSAFDSIMLADRNYSRLCGLSEQLDTELDQGLIDLESWAAARRNIDLRIEKAWQRVLKERPELIDNEELQTCSLDTKAHTEHSRALTIDYSILSSTSVFSSLKDDNFFKKCACFVLTGYKAVSNILNNTKEILKEGLV